MTHYTHTQLERERERERGKRERERERGEVCVCVCACLSFTSKFSLLTIPTTHNTHALRVNIIVMNFSMMDMAKWVGATAVSLPYGYAAGTSYAAFSVPFGECWCPHKQEKKNECNGWLTTRPLSPTPTPTKPKRSQESGQRFPCSPCVPLG